MDSEAKKEVERLLQSGEKLQAIKYLMDTFHLSIGDAKKLVEVVEVEQRAENIVTSSLSPQTSGTSLSGDLKMDVTQLLKANKKLDAIKLVKSRLNSSLKDALRKVEEVQQELDPNFKPAELDATGCLGGAFKTFSAIFGFVGLLLLGVALTIYWFQSRQIEHSIRTTGRVTGFNYGDGSAPIVTYEANGKTLQYHSTTYSSPPAYEMDEVVNIYVSTEDPSDVIIDDVLDRWLPILIFGGIGAVFTLVAFGFMFSGSKLTTASTRK